MSPKFFYNLLILYHSLSLFHNSASYTNSHDTAKLKFKKESTTDCLPLDYSNGFPMPVQIHAPCANSVRPQKRDYPKKIYCILIHFDSDFDPPLLVVHPHKETFHIDHVLCNLGCNGNEILFYLPVFTATLKRLFLKGGLH